MATTPWYLEIARVSSFERKQELLRLLHEVDGVTAFGSSSEPDHYVIFECSSLRLKAAVEKFLTEVTQPRSSPRRINQCCNRKAAKSPNKSRVRAGSLALAARVAGNFQAPEAVSADGTEAPPTDAAQAKQR